ncbi:hypothetical protein C8A05DRAFT_12109 [Staphylotrichum tortipilum]|uniref:Wax synthase domain-containing protein n=1 Tax=Staphylotrichum tortipilum TaxID=2831512 RepID=A0AAN6MTK4_9PEZI|nr:hypothetical protein C8A05DRAFT_12109 [Staphylotrichum longicolle]
MKDLKESGTEARFRLAAFRAVRATSLLLLHRTGTALVVKVVLCLRITLSDFAPDKQGLQPPTTLRDIFLRAVMSFQWIWSTYCSLVSAHDLLAVVFVSVLGWDRPDEWPPLFGSIWDATSLRRFWGVFWHWLHVSLFDAYISTGGRTIALPAAIPNWGGGGGGNLGKAARALCMFCMSAMCHAVTNRLMMGKANAAAEFRFFLSNYVICLAETVFVGALLGWRKEDRHLTACFAFMRRLVDYIWVSVIMFYSLLPGSISWYALPLDSESSRWFAVRVCT